MHARHSGGNRPPVVVLYSGLVKTSAESTVYIARYLGWQGGSARKRCPVRQPGTFRNACVMWPVYHSFQAASRVGSPKPFSTM